MSCLKLDHYGKPDSTERPFPQKSASTIPLAGFKPKVYQSCERTLTLLTTEHC